MHTVVRQTSTSTQGQGHKQTFIYTGARDYMVQTVLCHLVAAHIHTVVFEATDPITLERAVWTVKSLHWAVMTATNKDCSVKYILLNALNMENICHSICAAYIKSKQISQNILSCLSPLLLLPSSLLPPAHVTGQLSKQMLRSWRLCNEPRQVLSDIITSKHLRKPPNSSFQLLILWIQLQSSCFNNQYYESLWQFSG